MVPSEVDRSLSILQTYFTHFASENPGAVFELIITIAGKIHKILILTFSERLGGGRKQSAPPKTSDLEKEMENSESHSPTKDNSITFLMLEMLQSILITNMEAIKL